MKPKCSAVWQIFKKTSEGIVFCSLCQREFVFHGNTTNMRDHIRRRHANCMDSILQSFTDPNAEMNKGIKKERITKKRVIKKTGPDNKNVIEVVECELVGTDENNTTINNSDMGNEDDDGYGKSYKQTIIQRKSRESTTNTANSSGVISFLSDIKKKHDQMRYQNEMSEQIMCPTLCSDPLDKFFSSMCGITKSLCPALQLCVKRKLFEATTEAEETYINNGEQMPEKCRDYGYSGTCTSYHENIVVCHKSCSFALGRFFASMCDTTKTFPRQAQLEIKRKLFEAVSKAEESSIHYENEQNKIVEESNDESPAYHTDTVETTLPDNYQYNVQFTALPTSTPIPQSAAFEDHDGTITVTLA